MSTTRTRIRPPVLDELCARGIEVARAAAKEVAGQDQVGEHVQMVAEGDRVVTHLFDCRDPAYGGWRWAVTVARAARAKTVTVSETVLLPGPDALLAPEWVPWRERLQPGDLGVGDLLPALHDDDRLVLLAAAGGGDSPAWSQVEDQAAWDDAGLPIGVPLAGRRRVLSALGRDETAERWYATDHGPRAPLARSAPALCASCGFFVPLSPPLGRVFGACANEYAPDDGRVVSSDHGCGAHSEAAVPADANQAALPIIDELGYDLLALPDVAMEETAFESLEDG